LNRNGTQAVEMAAFAAAGCAERARALDVSVVVVSYNTRQETMACIESIHRETKGLSFEVILVDNASNDGSAEAAGAQEGRVRLLANRTNKGFACACNQGMRAASGKYVLLLNPDTEILDNAIKKTVEYAERRPDAAVVGCRVLGTDGNQRSNIFRCNRLIHLFWNIFIPYGMIGGTRLERSAFWNAHRYGGADLDKELEVETVAGCFMLVRMDAIREAGLMDERFFLYGEETEWCHRIRRKGWKVLYFPGASVIHHEGASSSKNRGKAALAEARSYILLHYLVGGLLSAYMANLLCLVRDAPRVLAWLALSRMPATRSRRITRVLEASRHRFPFHVRAVYSKKAMLQRDDMESE